MENLACIFWFLEEKRKIKQFWPKIENLAFGPQKPETVLFYNWNSTRKIWHTFSDFWWKRKENKGILTKNRTFSVEPPQKIENVLFYNENSTGTIWHIFSCSYRKRKENATFWPKIENVSFEPKKLEKVGVHFLVFGEKEQSWPKIENFRLGPKNSKKCFFTMRIQHGKSGIHFLVFGEEERKMKPFWTTIEKIRFDLKNSKNVILQ